MSNQTQNVVVHKANVPMLKGESLREFTSKLREEGRNHVKLKQNLPDKGVDVYMVEAFGDMAVFEVYRYGETIPTNTPRMQFFAAPFTRDANGKFAFGDTVEVRRVTSFEPVKTTVAKAATMPVSKPFPNEHAARQTDPGKYSKFRRGTIAPGVSVVYGITSAGKSEIQTLRFDASKFTAAQAKAWLKEHKFSAAKFEAASKPKKSTTTTKRVVGDWEETSKSFWGGVL